MMQNYFVRQALDIDIREDKLPAWARDKLKTMRRVTTEARAELSALKSGSEPGPFWIASWEDSRERFYLPQNSGRLIFGDPATGEEFTFSAGGKQVGEEGLLTIHAREGLAVMPHSSNVIQLKGTEP